MKQKIHVLVVAAFCGFFGLVHSAFGQGSLTPSGAPGPTMKSLDQVEPRILINATNCPGDAINSFIISRSGSYYLGTNVTGASGKNGILISADNVTINLNGFSITGVPGGNIGITTTAAHRGVRILHGNVTDWPAAGIVVSGTGAIVSDIAVLNSGAAIVLDQQAATLVKHCTVQNITVTGSQFICISADDVESCTLANLSGPANLFGISAYTHVSGCSVQTLGAPSVTAITCTGTVFDSSVLNLSGTTINGIIGSEVSHCLVSSVGTVSTTSIVGISGSVVSDCKVSGMSQGAASSLSSIGISCFSIVNCQVFNVTFNSTAFTWGIKASQLAKGCSATNVHNSGTGSGAGIGLNFFSNSTGLITESRVDGCEIGIMTTDRCQVNNCVAAGCDSHGIQTGQRCSVLDCTVSSNGLVTTGAGITMDIRSQVMRCNANDNTGDGIAIVGGCRVEDCTAENNGAGSGAGAVGSGIRVVSGSGSRIEHNHLRDNHRYGVEAGAADVIAHNTSGNNGLGQYLPSSGANFGPLQTPATATNTMANF